MISGLYAQNSPVDMKLPVEETEALERVLTEFDSLTNDETFVHIFQRIMEPVPGKPSEFYGCDQRIDLVPSLNQLVEKLPQNAQIFDVGAGSGDVVDFALKNAPRGTVVNIEEPNRLLIKEYLEKLKKYDHLKTGFVLDGYLQDCYQKAIPKQDLILAIHMIYHLTDFTASSVDPEKDIIDAVSYLYEQLAPGGSIFLVYAANPGGLAIENLAEKYFRSAYPNDIYADNLVSIYEARNKLLGPEGTIASELLNRFPQTNPLLKSELRECHFFARSIADMGVIGLAGELCSSDNKPFDLAKLKFCWDYLVQHPEEVGLLKEERDVPQKGFWRADEPQVIAIITKT